MRLVPESGLEAGAEDASSGSVGGVCEVVGERVRAIRRDLGLTMAQFAEAAGSCGPSRFPSG